MRAIAELIFACCIALSLFNPSFASALIGDARVVTGGQIADVDADKALDASELEEEKVFVIPSEIDGEPVVELSTDTFLKLAADDKYSEELIGVKKIVIPDSVTTIAYDAFRFCGSLTSVEIPKSVTSIGDQAFIGCESLTSVKIPDSVTSIGDNAFDRCDKLASVEIPANVKLGDAAFPKSCRVIRRK